MKIIFLDIDGVLNGDTHDIQWLEAPRYGFYSPYLVRLLNKITDATDAKIVLSSTWRLGKELPEIQSILKEMGITAECIDRTEALNYKWSVRGNEIDKWLDENREYTFKDYVILDDDSDMLFPQRFNFVQTHGLVGLTEKSVERAIRILSGDRHSEDKEVEYIMEFKS